MLIASAKSYSQIHLDQNGLKTTVIGALQASGDQALRHDIGVIGYNSHHWQPGGLVIIELFNVSYGTGYAKYIIENGYGQGANHGTPVVKLVESQGAFHNARIAIGVPYDLSSSHGGYVNKALPIYLDVRYYSTYKARITYTQDKVDDITFLNQIKINTSPTIADIPDFTSSTVLDNNLSTSGNLTVKGGGIHYIENGDVGIGTTDPRGYKLAVNGKIRAQEIKVEASPWPDYVFEKSYQLPTLQETEKHIKEKGHLPGIPSAQEVGANGINVGEMNAKLLQKIEELTLYIIEQDKRLKEQGKLLKEQISAQQTEIEKLKKR